MLKDMDNLLRMEKISKSFPGVKALDSVHFELKRGEVHAIEKMVLENPLL